MKQAIDRMFTLDWERVIKQERFSSFVTREAKKDANLAEKPIDQVLNEIRDVLKDHYSVLEPCFRFYSSSGTTRSELDTAGDIIQEFISTYYTIATLQVARI